MMWSLAALVIGFCIDLLVGDPHSFPHPVVLIGKCISVLERVLRCVCPKTPSGERAAGAILWGAVVIISTAVPALLLWLCGWDCINVSAKSGTKPAFWTCAKS